MHACMHACIYIYIYTYMSLSLSLYVCIIHTEGLGIGFEGVEFRRYRVRRFRVEGFWALDVAWGSLRTMLGLGFRDVGFRV